MRTLWPVIQNLKENIVLASASPRRVEMLRQLGINFKQIPGNIDETHIENEKYEEYTKRLSREKALSVAAKEKDSLVIGCDTVVLYGKQCLGKPRDHNDALKMLRLLNGRSHRVCSGITIVLNNKTVLSDTAVTKVYFRNTEDTELQWYAALDEPLDKAGSYAIQGKGAILIDKIDGCYYNVVGFPLSKFVGLLKKL